MDIVGEQLAFSHCWSFWIPKCWPAPIFQCHEITHTSSDETFQQAGISSSNAFSFIKFGCGFSWPDDLLWSRVPCTVSYQSRGRSTSTWRIITVPTTRNRWFKHFCPLHLGIKVAKEDSTKWNNALLTWNGDRARLGSVVYQRVSPSSDTGQLASADPSCATVEGTLFLSHGGQIQQWAWPGAIWHTCFKQRQQSTYWVWNKKRYSHAGR